MPKSKIPDRWESYSKIGTVIHGTTILPIKVPLRESLTSSLPEDERFSPSQLLHLLNIKKLKLCGVVDLTFTTKYYDGQFFIQNGILYKKVFTAGHVIPDDKTYNEFASAIKELEKEGEIICVHCTHGLNRSGYLICRYLIESLNIEPQEAIRLFEEARGHKMERQNYINDLMQRKPGYNQPQSQSGWPVNESQMKQSSWNQYSHHTHQGYRRRDDDWNGHNGYENDRTHTSWNQRQGQRDWGYKPCDKQWNREHWNRDGPYRNHGAGYRLRQNDIDHKSGGCGSFRNERDERSNWRTGPSCDTDYYNGFDRSRDRPHGYSDRDGYGGSSRTYTPSSDNNSKQRPYGRGYRTQRQQWR